VVDYGTGSGILAIAALLRGAGFAAGTDTDPLAVSAARQNAALNAVTARLAVTACEAAGNAPEPLAAAGIRVADGLLFDVCMANILQVRSLQK
jgi:ribosomal protein L11 methylase PrmA